MICPLPPPKKKKKKHQFAKTSLLPKSFITSKRPKTAAISDWLGATTSGVDLEDQKLVVQSFTSDFPCHLSIFGKKTSGFFVGK